MHDRRRIAAEDGFTFVELLVGSAVALIVVGAAMTLMTTVLRAQPETTERAAQIQDGRTMIEGITRELRQAQAVTTTTTSSLEMVTLVDSAACGGAGASTAIICRVTYACTATACTRTETNADGSGSGSTEQIVRGIRDANVFSYTPATSPTYVAVELEFDADDGGETVTLIDGAAPRNWFDPGGGPA